MHDDEKILYDGLQKLYVVDKYLFEATVKDLNLGEREDSQNVRARWRKNAPLSGIFKDKSNVSLS